MNITTEEQIEHLAKYLYEEKGKQIGSHPTRFYGTWEGRQYTETFRKQAREYLKAAGAIDTPVDPTTDRLACQLYGLHCQRVDLPRGKWEYLPPSIKTSWHDEARTIIGIVKEQST